MTWPRAGRSFLDELGEITLNLQVKLLRVIEGGGYTPVGGKELKKPDIRIIAATNRNLQKHVEKGRMREDFFYRIHIIPITLPPLRARKEDIPLIVDHFLKEMTKGSPTHIPTGEMVEIMFKPFLAWKCKGASECDSTVCEHGAVRSDRSNRKALIRLETKKRTICHI